VLTGRPDEGVAALAVDLHGHADGEYRLMGHRPHEHAGYLRLTCCESPLHRFRKTCLFQGRAEGHPGIDELLHVAIDEHDVAALAHGQRGLGLALELGEVALAQRLRGGQCLQSLDLADDLTVNTRRQVTCLTHQLPPNLVELRVGDAKSRICAEQQERRNVCASEHDQQVPQRPGLAECRYRSDPQDDPGGDAEQANGGRQRGRVDRHRAVERVDSGQVAEQGEHHHGSGDAAEHGRSKAMPLETAQRERAAREPFCQRHHRC
jgi:hypothetical protein